MKGLCVLFGPSHYDNYYRLLNVSTSVNVTELNTTCSPSPGMITEFGIASRGYHTLNEDTCDMIICSFDESEYKGLKEENPWESWTRPKIY